MWLSYRRVLEIAKEHQNGRAEKKSAMADFTETLGSATAYLYAHAKVPLQLMEAMADGTIGRKTRRNVKPPSISWRDMVDITKANW